MVQHPLALLACMCLVVAFSRGLERRFKAIKKVSSAVVCTLLGIVLSNVGILPHESPVNEAVYTYGVPYAIVLIILASDLRDLKVAGIPITICFLLASAGSFVGALAAGLLFEDWIGPETWKVAGQFAGAFAGGGMNFAAVGRGLETSPSLFAASAVVDNLSTVPWMLTQVGLTVVLARYYPKLGEGRWASKRDDQVNARSDNGGDPRRVWTTTEMNITDMSILVALPLVGLWLAEQLSPLLPGFPQVLWLTTISIVLAQVPAIRRLKGAAVLSYFALHLFFIVLGASSVVSEVFTAGVSLFAFMIFIISIHAIVVYGLGWLFRFDLPTIALASQSAIGGPGSSLALAMSMKWQTLVAPSIIVGIFGYALGNYLGFACAYLVRALG
jgi:uncharacterized membrane protein